MDNATESHPHAAEVPAWKQNAIAWAAEQQGRHFCVCGCGQAVRVWWGHYHRGVPETIRGHFKRMRKSPAQLWIDNNQGKHRCECGCDEFIEIKIHHHTRGIPSFINGHTSRVANPMSGRSRERNPRFRGGYRVNRKGYVLVLIGTVNGRAVYKLQHRLVVEEHLGRPLNGDEIVHHRNGIKHDNRIENLEVMRNGNHTKLHAEKAEVGFGFQKRTKTGRWGEGGPCS